MVPEEDIVVESGSWSLASSSVTRRESVGVVVLLVVGVVIVVVVVVVVVVSSPFLTSTGPEGTNPPRNRLGPEVTEGKRDLPSFLVTLTWEYGAVYRIFPALFLASSGVAFPLEEEEEEEVDTEEDTDSLDLSSLALLITPQLTTTTRERRSRGPTYRENIFMQYSSRNFKTFFNLQISLFQSFLY